MFDFSCTSACNPPNPSANTVKVNLDDLSKRAEEAGAASAEAKKRLEEEAARSKAEALKKEEAARREKEAEERRKEGELQRQAEEKAAQAAKEAAAAAAEAAAAAAAESERKRAEEVEQAAEAAARKNEVMAWLKKQGFTGVNNPKKSLFSSTYPLHKAAEAGNAKIVGGLLEQGANPAQKNSAGKTAQEVVMKKKKADSHKEVLALLSSATGRT